MTFRFNNNDDNNNNLYIGFNECAVSTGACVQGRHLSSRRRLSVLWDQCFARELFGVFDLTNNFDIGAVYFSVLTNTQQLAI